jgi:hypothetical protein
LRQINKNRSDLVKKLGLIIVDDFFLETPALGVATLIDEFGDVRVSMLEQDWLFAFPEIQQRWVC